MVVQTYPLWCVDWCDWIQISNWKFNAFTFQLLIYLNNAIQVRLWFECIGPDLYEIQNFFLNGSRWIIFWPNQFHQILNEFFIRHKHMECFATIFDACLQHSQWIHNDRIIFAGILWQPLANCFHCIACCIRWFVNHITYFHIQSPVFRVQRCIGRLLCILNGIRKRLESIKQQNNRYKTFKYCL